MSTLSRYQKLDYDLPETIRRWQLSHGTLRDLELVEGAMPRPQDDEIAFRVDTNAICFSDVKVLKDPAGHPRMQGYDLAEKKLVPGHETSLTVTAVGDKAAERFEVGARYLVQADILKTGQAVGYNIWGGMLEFGVFGPTVQEYLIPVPDDVGYSQASLVEPWACVNASYRRADLRAGDANVLLVGGAGPMGQMHLDRCISMKRTGRCDTLERIVVTDVSIDRLGVVERRYSDRAAEQGITLVCVDVQAMSIPDALAQEGIDGFEYVVALCPVEPAVQEARQYLKKYGVLNLFAGFKRGKGALNMGDLHYDQHTVTGNSGSTMDDMRAMMALTRDGTIDTNYSCGELAGFKAGKEAIEKVAEAESCNKIVVYNQIPDLPLIPVAAAVDHVDFSPEVREQVLAGVWSREAEAEMLEQLLDLS